MQPNFLDNAGKSIAMQLPSVLKLPFGRIECELDILTDDDGRETSVSSRTIVSLGLNHWDAWLHHCKWAH